MPADLDTGRIREWRSITTLIVFCLTNIVVLFPFHIGIPFPRPAWNMFLRVLSALRIISPGFGRSHDSGFFVWKRFPMDFVTAPLIADLFLLAISAIGRQEVHDGTVGANGISPIDIMVFFLTLAYIAISIDASGLIRWLAFKVLEKGGRYGHRLFLYLYIFFYALTSFIGNDPVILSGTAFLAYMTRVSSNIMHPRAWIHTQFAVANIASAILVSSNPTNLVLAGAFGIKFINYTANIIVPVLVTGVVLFPFLLYIVFAHEDLIPEQILMHELTQEQKERKIVNPNIPNAGGVDEEEKNAAGGDLVEVMRPFLDKRGAGFGAVVMATTLITLLALNAASQSSHEHPVFWVTLPAATVMFCWDLWFGWNNRQETREAVEQLRKEAEETRAARARRRAEEQEAVRSATGLEKGAPVSYRQKPDQQEKDDLHRQSNENGSAGGHSELSTAVADEKLLEYDPAATPRRIDSNPRESERLQNENKQENYSSKSLEQDDVEEQSLQTRNQTSIETLIRDGYRWAQITFPTATTVFTHLPFKLVPFALAMFVLVQGLVTTGWVPVFAYGWDHWVYKTGTVGAIGGMGFVSVILCNFAGTNIGTTILISRVLQAWQEIHRVNGTSISDRTFWGTVYSMALGVNYGAFSVAFSASLAGLLWRDILARKYIVISRLEFAKANLPVIAVAMTVGCAVLVGEVYIVRDNSPYNE